GLGPDLPVEVTQVVARHIFAVLHELDAVTEERAPVHAGNESFDHVPGAQIQPGDARDCLRVEEASGVVVFCGHWSGYLLACVMVNSCSEGVFLNRTIHSSRVNSIEGRSSSANWKEATFEIVPWPP